MKYMGHTLALTTCLLALGACQSPSPEAYANRGDPERLLTKSTEQVHIDLASADAIDLLSESINRERPNRAVMHCDAAKPGCKKAKNVLIKAHIPSENSGAGNEVELVYERVLARDCEQRYIDNSSNVNNLNASSFGCAITGNTVQMVTDKRQFTNPGLLGYRDGDKAAQVYENYGKPPAAASESGAVGGSSIVNSGSSGTQ